MDSLTFKNVPFGIAEREIVEYTQFVICPQTTLGGGVYEKRGFKRGKKPSSSVPRVLSARGCPGHFKVQGKWPILSAILWRTVSLTPEMVLLEHGFAS